MAVFSKDEKNEYIYKDLGKNDGKTEKLFESMKDVYMVAFLLGVLNDEKLSISKKGDPIKDIYFEDDDRYLMELIALDLTKDINILNKKEESEKYIHSLVENYANSGICKLDELLGGEHFDLDNFISMIKEYEKIEKPKTFELDDLFSEI